MVKTYIPVIKNDVATSQITNFGVDFGLFFSVVTDLVNFGLQVPMQQVTATILSTTFSNINWIFMKIAFKMLLHSSYCKIKKFPRCWRSAKICLYHYLICGLLLQTQAHKVSKVGTKVPTYKRPGCLAACWEWTIHWCESQTILEFFFYLLCRIRDKFVA